MGYLGQYTAFNSELDEGEYEPLKITDLDKFIEFREEYNLKDKNTHWEWEVTNGYPQEKYKVLYGFTHGQTNFAINKIAFERDEERFYNFFHDLAECVETPFKFYHSANDSHWKNVKPDSSNNIQDLEKLADLYKVVVKEDEVKVQKIEVQHRIKTKEQVDKK